MDTENRESSGQDAKVTCPECKGTEKKQNLQLGGLRGCVLCRGTGEVSPDYVLSELEKKVMDYIWMEVPTGTACPHCGTQIEPEGCIEDTTSSRECWAKLVREVIKMVEGGHQGESKPRE